MKTRIRIETGGYSEKLDLSIEGLDEETVQVIINDIFTTLQEATEATQRVKEYITR